MESETRKCAQADCGHEIAAHRLAKWGGVPAYCVDCERAAIDRSTHIHEFLPETVAETVEHCIGPDCPFGCAPVTEEPLREVDEQPARRFGVTGREDGWAVIEDRASNGWWFRLSFHPAGDARRYTKYMSGGPWSLEEAERIVNALNGAWAPATPPAPVESPAPSQVPPVESPSPEPIVPVREWKPTDEAAWRRRTVKLKERIAQGTWTIHGDNLVVHESELRPLPESEPEPSVKPEIVPLTNAESLTESDRATIAEIDAELMERACVCAVHSFEDFWDDFEFARNTLSIAEAKDLALRAWNAAILEEKMATLLGLPTGEDR